LVPLIVQDWLALSAEHAPEVQIALRIAIVQFCCQLANNASLGYWNGTQRQVRASLSQCGFATARHASAVLLVLCWQATPLAWLIPFALLSVAEWAFNDWLVRRELSDRPLRPVSRDDLLGLWREAAFLVVGVLLGMFLSQLDRLALSAHVTVADFGRYGLVASLSLAFMQLQQPVVRAWQPTLAVSAGSPAGRRASLRMALSLIAACVLPCALAAWQAPAILKAWIGDPQTTELGSTPMRLLLAAVALNAVYQVLYQTMLLSSRASDILKINLAIVVMMTPLSFLLVQRFGIVGGGLVWLGVSLLQVTLGGFAVARR
jgi:O-antigen/teichoic acid export membrane protein